MPAKKHKQATLLTYSSFMITISTATKPEFTSMKMLDLTTTDHLTLKRNTQLQKELRFRLQVSRYVQVCVCAAVCKL